ncbi:hypothetical protein M422DRAFT_257301 [Sphaerobolus stellatus SS14]|uniref:Zn(2)-C6 fungal-type domain-containing protein n=1 Tax=Sphaerobolus stellatus (strain SS14) TaxID=990650 RepID=A0A0C9UA44_SPHS4|nr:hypothetical protein M422DRAFT_257301 [Sphaerobolus stellatus SS14]
MGGFQYHVLQIFIPPINLIDLLFPACMLAWKTSNKVKCMEDVLRPALKFSFDDPNEEEEDHLSKVRHYWQEAQEKEKQKEKEKEKEKEKQKGKEKEVGLFRSSKGKGKEVPKMPKKPTPKKSNCEVHLESEEDDEDDDKPQSCIYCVKKKIPCVPQCGKKVCIACGQRKMKCKFFNKTAWAVMEESQKVADSVWELVELEEQREAGHLEEIWHNLQMCLRQLEQKAVADSVTVDARVLQLLELKSRGIEVPADMEKWIWAERGLVQSTLKDHTEDITEWMDEIQVRTAWTQNDLPKINTEEAPPQAASQGTKRKGDEDRDCMEGNKKKKKVVETEEEV